MIPSLTDTNPVSSHLFFLALKAICFQFVYFALGLLRYFRSLSGGLDS